MSIHLPTSSEARLTSQVINAVRNSPSWKDSVFFLTYDEHGGFYDHADPPPAPQGGARTPMASTRASAKTDHLPSEQPGGGAECSSNLISTTDTSVKGAEQLCPQMTANPAGPYPANCPHFNQLGVRIPFIAISPFSKPHYVSHVRRPHLHAGPDRKRFLSSRGTTQHNPPR